MAAPLYQTISNAAGGSAANVSVTKPAGSVQDDIEIALLYIEHPTAVITPVDAWTSIRDSLQAGPAAFDYRHITYWRRVGGADPASYVFNFSAAAYREAYVFRVSGCIASGSPVDAEGINIAATRNAPATAPSITTVTEECLLLSLFTSADGGNAVWAVGSSGLTLRLGSVSVALFTLASVTPPQATGAKTVSLTGGANPDYIVGASIALRPPAGAAAAVVPMRARRGVGI